MPKPGAWLLLAALAGAFAGAGEAEGAGHAIYRCNSGDAVIFSDRPCDVDAEVYEANTPLNTYEPPKTAPRSRPSTIVRRRPDPDPDRQAAARAELAEKCRRIQQSLRDIRSKMRSGYTAKEGVRLAERQSRLEEQRRAAKCR